jgi:hypothetical protein
MLSPGGEEMAVKRSTVWSVDRISDFFGEQETVQRFDTKRDATAYAKQLNRTAANTEDPDDKIRYEVFSETLERPA